MDQSVAMMGALGIGVFLVVSFFIFSKRIGALAAFGRKPLDNRRFLALSAAAFIPGAGCLSSISLCGINGALDYPLFLAMAMATITAISRQGFIALERLALKNEKK